MHRPRTVARFASRWLLAACYVATAVTFAVSSATAEGNGGPNARDANRVPGGVAYSPGVKFDRMAWDAFIGAVKPVADTAAPLLTFETWATDADTYADPPSWPGTQPVAEAARPRLQLSVQRRLKLPGALSAAVTASGPDGTAALNCGLPGDPQAGNFPVAAHGTPQNGLNANCIAEEVRRNRASFDYIVGQGLTTQTGLAKAFERWAASGYKAGIDFPTAAVELKADWVPVPTVVTWLKQNGVAQADAALVRREYHTLTQSASPGVAVEFALVSMHVSTKQLPNWLWVTFEHYLTPGRCDTMGCHDQYGAAGAQSQVPPKPEWNQQYGTCDKSAALRREFARNGLSPVWNGYCMKVTQIDFVSTQPATRGRPTLGGNSLTERVNAATPMSMSSCISCHANAGFDSSGRVSTAVSLSPIGANAAGPTIMSYDFVWALLNVPEPKGPQID